MADGKDMSRSDDAIDEDLQGLIASLRAQMGAGSEGSLPPVHSWNPDRRIDIQLEIRRDGTWYHEGDPILRDRLVRLFSTILRKDDDGFYLVTPAEKAVVHVEDVPFVAIRLERTGEGDGQVLVAVTNVDDIVLIDAEHPLRVEINSETDEPTPYVMVRAGLEARLTRSAFYELVSWATEADGVLSICSSGVKFSLGKVGEE